MRTGVKKASPARSRHQRLSSSDWIDLGARILRREGPTKLTLERLCLESGRTKGSFYHHFASIDAFLLALAQYWHETFTSMIAETILKIEDPKQALRELARRSRELDTRLEVGIRALAATDVAVRRVTKQTDDAREQTIAQLLGAAYGLGEAERVAFARLFHGLHISALLRSPEDIGAFSAAPTRELESLLESKAADRC